MNTFNVDSESEFFQEWRTWRAGWEGFLSQPHGWLAVTSFNWVDTKAAEHPGLPGRWWQDGSVLHVDPQGRTMSYDGESFTEPRGIDLSCEPDDTRIIAGDIQIGVTYRGQYLLVTYDPESPARARFRGVPTFEPDPQWVLTGTFEPYADPKSVAIDSVATDSHLYRTPGIVRFNHEGAEYTLLLTAADYGMNAVFTDATSGVTTYGACRTVAVSEPDEDNNVVLDFNRAINLPCAFNSMPVCPTAPPDNRLPFAVEAGEMTPYEHAN